MSYKQYMILFVILAVLLGILSYMPRQSKKETEKQGTEKRSSTFNAFVDFNGQLLRNNHYTDMRNEALLASISKQCNNSTTTYRIAFKPSYDKALLLDQWSKSFCHYIDSVKVLLISKTLGVSTTVADTLRMRDYSPDENTEIPGKVMFGTHDASEIDTVVIARRIKNRVGEYRKMIMKFVYVDDTTGLHISLRTPDIYSLEEDKKIDWEHVQFYNKSLLATLASLNCIENEIKTSENAILHQ